MSAKSRLVRLTLLAGLALPALCGAEASLDGEAYAPGTTAVVRFESRDYPRDLSLVGLAQKPRFHTDEADADPARAWALLAVPLESKPGRKPVVVRWHEGGVERRQTLWLVVKRRKAVREALRIEGFKAAAAKMGRENRLLRRASSRGEGVPQWDGLLEPPITAPVSTYFGVGRTYNRGEGGWGHKGLDLAAPEGTPVGASNAGTVTLARALAAHGKAVVVDHGFGLATCYFHLSRINVREGQAVDKGQVLGEVGSTGISTGPHLHWQVMVNGHAVDPMQWIDPSRKAQLQILTAQRRQRLGRGD